MKDLVLIKGKYVDQSVTPHEPFHGVVPRDLEIGDIFMSFTDDGLQTREVTDKEIMEDGSIQMSTSEVQ